MYYFYLRNFFLTIDTEIFETFLHLKNYDMHLVSMQRCIFQRYSEHILVPHRASV